MGQKSVTRQASFPSIDGPEESRRWQRIPDRGPGCWSGGWQERVRVRLFQTGGITQESDC